MISMTLPSLHPNGLERTLSNVRDATCGSYQVVVVSPFEPPKIVSAQGSITWVRESEPRGCNAGHASALQKVTGDFIMPWVDDHFLCDGWDVEVLADFADREHRKPFILGLRQAVHQQIGTVFGRYYAYFPFMRAETARQFGWFNQNYRMDFADCDLSLRVLAAGGAVEWSRYGLISIHRDDERKNGREFCKPDQDLFLRQWKGVYGEGWRTSGLRDFNIDVAIDQPENLDDRIELHGRTAVPSGKIR